MFSDSSDDIPSGGKCECFKKLHLLGVPLYISDEADEYSENRNVVFHEPAFKLPGVLSINENITQYPDVGKTDLPIVFRLMAEVIPSLSDFELNPLSFWILDVFIEGLWTAQTHIFPFFHQKVTLLWIAYFFNYIQENNPSQKELFKNLKMILFAPEGIKYNEDSDVTFNDSNEESTRSDEKEGEKVEKAFTSKRNGVWRLPLPPDYNGKIEDVISDGISSKSDTNSTATESGEKTESIKSSIKTTETIPERNVRHMKVILEILYRIFGRPWVFAEIQATIHNMPPVEDVELPFTLHVPKLQLKTDSIILPKGDKNGKKTLVPGKSLEEIETEKELHKHDFILPLQASEEAKLYAKEFFGPPASAQSVLVKGKGKK